MAEQKKAPTSPAPDERDAKITQLQEENARLLAEVENVNTKLGQTEADRNHLAQRLGAVSEALDKSVQTAKVGGDIADRAIAIITSIQGGQETSQRQLTDAQAALKAAVEDARSAREALDLRMREG